MRYICSVCGYVYDEEVEGVPFADLPSDYQCPLCTAPKDFFEAAEKEEKKLKEVTIDEDLHELSNGEIAATLSNLARGLEKQYKFEASKDMQDLADYFTGNLPSLEDSSLEALSKLIDEDLEVNYPNVQKCAQDNNDRGTQRIVVWGTKVSNIIKALLDTYKKAGEKALLGKKVFVCSVCGFIYVGEKAPELCPVCKVPSWKFEEVKRR